MKKEMINQFLTLFAHTTPLYSHNFPPQIIYIDKILPKATYQENNATIGGTFTCHTIF